MHWCGGMQATRHARRVYVGGLPLMANEQVGYLSIDSLGVRFRNFASQVVSIYPCCCNNAITELDLFCHEYCMCGVHHIPSWSSCMVHQVESIAAQRCMLEICWLAIWKMGIGSDIVTCLVQMLGQHICVWAVFSIGLFFSPSIKSLTGLRLKMKRLSPSEFLKHCNSAPYISFGS
jgi:hypothetical protein